MLDLFLNAIFSALGAMHSLIKHLLGVLLELGATIHVAGLFGSAGTIGLLVDYHALGATAWIVFLSRRTIALICGVLPGVILGPTWLLLDDIHHTVLEGFFVLR